MSWPASQIDDRTKASNNERKHNICEQSHSAGRKVHVRKQGTIVIEKSAAFNLSKY